MPNVYVVTKEVRTREQYGYAPVAAFESEKKAKSYLRKQADASDRRPYGKYVSEKEWYAETPGGWERVSVKEKWFKKIPERIYLTQEEICSKDRVVCVSKLTSKKMSDDDLWIPVKKNADVFDHVDVVLTVLLVLSVAMIGLSAFFKWKTIASVLTVFVLCVLLTCFLSGCYFALIKTKVSRK